MSKACFKRAALAERQLSFAQGNTRWQHSGGDLTGKLQHVEFIYLDKNTETRHSESDTNIKITIAQLLG